MTVQTKSAGSHNLTAIKGLTFLMFTMFAMTTDSVGAIIPKVVEEFGLSNTAAGAFHYAPMLAIAFAGILFGFFADKLGRKKTIILGLVLFALNSYLFAVGNAFAFFLMLLIISGVAIGIFKTGALALIGDISKSTVEHTSLMNAVEGFFGVGAIIGPFILAYLMGIGVSWKFLYVIAGSICMLLILTAALVKYPETKGSAAEPLNFKKTLQMVGNPYAFGFSMGAFLYVAAECAVYVWMPTLLEGYKGNFLWVATYAISIFFVLRAAGRFLGAWILRRYSWSTLLVIMSSAIFLCFLGSVIGGVGAAVLLLPISGSFMSVVYPTINSKGISCFPKHQHGAVAGVILFFTCAAAALGPLMMGAVSDLFGNMLSGFILATGFAALLCLGAIYNAVKKPADARLLMLQKSEYEIAASE